MYWSWKKPPKATPFSMSTSEIGSKNLLVIFPASFEDFDTARLILEPLIERMNPTCLTILVRDNFRSWLPPDLRARIIPFDPASKTFLGLPMPKFCQLVKDVEADVVIDLTPEFYAFTSGLAAASEAPLRISLNHEYAGKFYNLLITPEPGRSLSERYELLLNYV
jgi:hypothetical protein